MHMHILPCTARDLPALERYPDTRMEQDLHEHLRWCLHTPYARVVKAMVQTEGGEVVAGVAAAVAHGASGWITQMDVEEPWWGSGCNTLLAQALLTWLEGEGCTVQRAVAEVLEDRRALEALGFAHEGELVQYGGGTFHEATREEVVALEPLYLVGALHLDRRCTGEDRRTLLMEQLYLGTVYVEQGRVRGLLLPLNGRGLLIADAPDVAFELQRWMLPLQESVTAPEANTALHAHMTALDHRSMWVGTRLVRGTPALPWRPELCYAGGGWG